MLGRQNRCAHYKSSAASEGEKEKYDRREVAGRSKAKKGGDQVGETREVSIQDEEKADGLRKNSAALARKDAEGKIP